MTKTETWANAQKVLTELGLSKKKHAEALTLFEELLAPKSKVSTRPQPKEIDGVLYYYCRFTDRYWLSGDMVYQNQEKRDKLEDKGYSAIGMSLWNKGQKYLKDLQIQSVEIAYGDDQSDEIRQKGMDLHNEFKDLKERNVMNDGHYLYETFVTDAQVEYSEANSEIM